MKHIIYVLLLSLGLVALSACTLPRQEEAKSIPVSEQSEATDINASSSVVADGSYQVKTADSRLAWQAAKVTAKHTGTVSIKSGAVQVADNKLTGASFVIDMTSITSDEGIDGLVKHLSSADFFDAAAYPEAKLTVTAVKAGAKDGEYAVTGDLTIKNITAAIDFTARVSADAGGLKAEANLDIDRTKWEIKYGSGKFFQNLGDKMIDDDIKFSVIIKASR